MTITKEWSIAEDSTLSASPPPLRRAARTYGRPKVNPEPDESVTAPSTASYSATRPNIYRTGPTDTTEEIPATSDELLSYDEEESVAEDPVHIRQDRPSSPVAVTQQHVSVPRPEEHKYTLQHLLESLRPPTPPSSSDPIQSFHSSSPATIRTELDHPESKLEGQQATPTLKRQISDLPLLPTDSDEPLPEVSEILKKQDQKPSKADRAKELAEVKKWALAKQAEQFASTSMDDSDDDLEIVNDMKVVAEEEMDQRRAIKARHMRPSEGRKRQMALGRVNVAHGHRSPPVRKLRDPLEQLKVMAQPSFASSSRDNHGMGTRTREKLTPSDLNRILTKKIAEDNSKITHSKEAEWVKKGGKLTEQLRQGDAGSKGIPTAWKVYTEKGLKVIAEKNKKLQDEEDDSDDEWTPTTNGATSPSRNNSEGDVQSDNEDGKVNSEEEVVANLEGDGGPDEHHNDKQPVRPRRPRRGISRPRAIRDSDDEDELMSAPFGRLVGPDDTQFTTPRRQMPKISHRASVSSFEDPTEDETDKENNTRLMYDKSEDKENKAVVRHSPGGMSSSRGGTLPASASIKGFKRPFSSPRDSLSDDDNEATGEGRTPFKDLSDDPFTSPALRDEIPFATKLQQASPIATQSSRPVIWGTGGPGFSQFPDEKDNSQNASCIVEAPKLGGLTQAFEFGTERPSSIPLNPQKSDLRSSVIDTNRSVLDHLRKDDNPDDLSLTLDVHLQPALEVSENVRRQADTIFEKEQVYVLEAARQKQVYKETLYVNDHGFLTQTRPDDMSSPDIYRVASTQMSEPLLSQGVGSVPQSATRHPLRTLSFSQDLLTPPSNSSGSSSNNSGRTPFARLRRRSLSPLLEQMGYRSSPSPGPPTRKTNAFEALALGQARAEKRKKERERLGKSDFVETEAQESDEDERFGFSALKKMTGGAEDEDDGEHLDKHLDSLVDDVQMDAETQAVDLVLEKVKEHQEEDDRALEKYHRDAAEGKLRIKRRGRGLDMEDSDEEEDDDERASRIRRQMYKKRKIGEDIEALGKNEETRAFYDAYQRDLVDDPMDFGQPEEDNPVVEEEEEQEIVSTAEIRERVREMARGDETFNVVSNDMSWVDDSEDEGHDGILIKEAAPTKKPVLPRTALGQVDFDHNLERPKRTVETETERVRLASWAKAENRSRNLGMARSAAGSSVTGHKRAKVKAGDGSMRIARHGPGPAARSGSGSTTEVRDGGRKLSKRSSVLAGIADRTRRFEQC